MRKRDSAILLIMAASVLLLLLVLAVGSSDDEEGGLSFGFGGMGDRVALIQVTGAIESSESIVRQIRHWSTDRSVAAIVLRLDSPGGGVAASQEIFEEIGKAREKGKKVVASMGSVAASGAYYIACAVDTVVANPGTLTGSIGVILQYPVFEGLMDKVGVRLETIRSGEFKDVGNPSRSITPREEEMLQSVIDNTFDQFVDVVAEGRRMSRDSVLSFATGAIFTGEQALDLGLVDVLGDYQDAIDMAATMAGLEANPRTVHTPSRRRLGLLDILGSYLGLHWNHEEGMVGPRLAYLFTY
jgi:protease-4